MVFVVMGRVRPKANQASETSPAVGVFESLELAADYARSLVEFHVYRAPINGFRGAELIVHSSSSGAIEWIGSSDLAGDREKFLGIDPARPSADDRESDIRDEEHLDWEV